MNTLQELNTYSNSQIPFEDDRSLIITTSSTSVPTTAVTIAEDAPVDLTAFGVEFSELRSLDNSTLDNIRLDFDFTTASNPAVEWPDKTAFIEGNTKYNNITFSTPIPRVFVVEGIQLNSDYLAILANTIIVARDQAAVYSYTITVSWPGNTYTQQFDVTTTPSTAETNLNGLNLTATSLFAHLLFDPGLVPTPAVTDPAPLSEYSLQLTSTAGATLGATVGAAPASSVTVTGDKLAVNAALAVVSYTPLNGSYQQTDVINYTLTVTNPAGGGSYVSETGSFNNYIPAFVQMVGITGRSTNSSATGDLFISPFPSVEENIGVNTIQLVITTTAGEIKASAGSGTWVNSITMTGDGSGLTSQLSALQYKPPIITGTNTATLNYTLTWSGFNLDSGSWLHETTIDTVLSNLGGTGDTVTDIGVDSMFPAGYYGGVLPNIVSTDTNTEYNLTLTFGSTAAINGTTGTVQFVGSPSAIKSALLAATYRPLTQSTTHAVSYTFTLRGVSLQTGGLTKALPTYFQISTAPSSITRIDQFDDVLFGAPLIPVVLDNTSGYNSLDFKLIVGNTGTPGVFNPSTAPSAGGVTYTGYVTPTGGDPDVNQLIVPTTYNPYDYVAATTEVISYSVEADSIAWVTGSFNLLVPQQIQFSGIGAARSYTENTFLNTLFVQDAVFLTDVSELASPSRAFTIEFETSAGYISRDNNVFNYPYSNPLVLGPATLTQLNDNLQGNIQPFIYIPAAGSTASETITIRLKDAGTLISTGIMTITGVARTTNIPGEGVYTATPGTGVDIPITEEMFLYCEMDAVALSGAGGSCNTVINQTPLYVDASGGGGDGAIVVLAAVPLDRFDEDTVNYDGALVLAAGAGGPLGSIYGIDGGNSVISYKKLDGSGNYTTPIADPLIVYGGGGGNATGFQNGNANIPGNDGGNGAGGGASFGNIGGTPTTAVYAGGNAVPATRDNTYINASEFTELGNPGLSGSLTGASNTVPKGGDGGIVSFASNITGLTLTYSAPGGVPTWYATNDNGSAGANGKIVVRIKQR